MPPLLIVPVIAKSSGTVLFNNKEAVNKAAALPALGPPTMPGKARIVNRKSYLEQSISSCLQATCWAKRKEA
ncbi:Uncharacterised protein [uncultured archaeon]|nr:Uncharacterised protein [uncultured archaeon]